MIRAILALLLCAAPCSITHAQTAPAQSAYLLGCGGCHGIDGRSYAPNVPDLAGQAGYFLCTPGGRAYIARLPNVAYAHLSNERLADVMNYVTFTLGGAAPSAQPFTAAEMAAARANPLAEPAMLEHRSAVLRQIMKVCPQAAGLRDYGG